MTDLGGTALSFYLPLWRMIYLYYIYIGCVIQVMVRDDTSTTLVERFRSPRVCVEVGFMVYGG